LRCRSNTEAPRHRSSRAGSLPHWIAFVRTIRSNCGSLLAMAIYEMTCHRGRMRKHCCFRRVEQVFSNCACCQSC
jgi:hypothetical protein